MAIVMDPLTSTGLVHWGHAKAFRLRAEPGKEIVLVAGGTGITPFISFLEQACAEGCSTPVALFYGVASSGHILYRDVIKKAQGSLKQFTCTVFVEEVNETPEGALSGRLDLERILERVDNVDSCVFYLAGPPAMTKYFQSGLGTKGVAKEDIRIDDWD